MDVWEIIKNLGAGLNIIVIAVAVYKLSVAPALKGQKTDSTLENVAKRVLCLEDTYKEENMKARMDDADRRLALLEKFREMEDSKRETEAVNKHVLENHTQALKELSAEVKSSGEGMRAEMKEMNNYNNRMISDITSSVKILTDQMVNISKVAQRAEEKADVANNRIDSLSRNVESLCVIVGKLAEVKEVDPGAVEEVKQLLGGMSEHKSR